MRMQFHLLTPDMDRAGFFCGDQKLDAYLHTQAALDMPRCLASVITARRQDSATIAGYCTLQAASVRLDSLPEFQQRCLPRRLSVPAVRLARLAVDTPMQGQHIGGLLVLDALHRVCSSELDWAVFLVDVHNDRAAMFYEKFLFQRFADNPFALWMSRKQAEKLSEQLD